MAKKKNKKRNTAPPKPSVRLSQVMIVKNEEKNIEKALSWAKAVAFEQIVVDTGSTDKTVEIAKRMGAKVHHFEWIDDFAAARNYAMDLAKGNWIANLDADEYMSESDAKELLGIIKKIQNDKTLLDKCDAIQCPFYNLDDSGNVQSVLYLQRIYQNRRDLRFFGKIHEVIALKNGYYEATNISIIHTGYTRAEYIDKAKSLRNTKMLRAEVERDPDNVTMKYYLADSIKAIGTDEASKEAEEIFLDALSVGNQTNIPIKQLAYTYLIPRYSGIDEKKGKALELCNDAIRELPACIDFRYYRAAINNQNGSFAKACEDLYKCEEALMNAESAPTTHVLVPTPILLYYQLLTAVNALGDEPGIIKCNTVIHAILAESKGQSIALGPYIRAMSWDGMDADEILSDISSIYDINNPKEMLFIARTAKDAGAIELTRGIMGKIEKMLG